MQRFLSSVSIASLFVLGAAAPGASAASVADLTVEGASSPVSVSPPGGIAIHTVRVANNGPSASPADVVIASSGGAAYVAGSSRIPAECVAPSDGAVDPTVTCRFTSVLPSSLEEPRRITVALRTPSVAGSVTSDATVAVPPGTVDIVDGDTANNSATINTPVFFSSDGSSALVREGETLAFRKHLFSVRSSLQGVITMLSTVPAGTVAGECGGDLCGAGLKVDFDTNPDYQGLGAVEIQFDVTEPCRGKGAPAGCDDLFMRKNGMTSELPFCSLPTQNLCIETRVKVGSEFRWTVRIDSTDPEFVPPLPRSLGQ